MSELPSAYKKALERAQPEREGADVYRYDDFPEKLRVQVVHIWREIMRSRVGERYFGESSPAFAEAHQKICSEYGEFRLTHNAQTPFEDVCRFFLGVNEIDKCLFIIETVFASFVNLAHLDRDWLDGPSEIRNGINQLNRRLNETSVGFEFRDGQFFRANSAFLHKEVVVPALTLLEASHFQGANQEFRSAHEHYRYGRYKECLNECLKAFESTMKAICHERGWAYQQTDTAKKLMAVCKDNGLFPVFMDNHLNGLVMCMESGVPTARNKTSGHGQGTTPTDVAPEFAAYLLHLTAANILFLASAEKRLK